VTLCGFLAVAIRRGEREVEPASTLRFAADYWHAGAYGAALSQRSLGYGMALDAGVRNLTVDAIYQLPKNSDLQAQLTICDATVWILGRYDSEGSQSFYCTEIEDQIKIDKCRVRCETYCAGYGVVCTP
jgi:hypothetical protein